MPKMGQLVKIGEGIEALEKVTMGRLVDESGMPKEEIRLGVGHDDPYKPEKTYEILERAAGTYRERNKLYGDNYKRVGDVMKGFFPNGVTLVTEDDHNRFHIFMLVIVKLTRYTQNWYPKLKKEGEPLELGHKDSNHDATVYSAMLEEIDDEICKRHNRVHDRQLSSNNQKDDGENLAGQVVKPKS